MIFLPELLHRFGAVLDRDADYVEVVPPVLVIQRFHVLNHLVHGLVVDGEKGDQRLFLSDGVIQPEGFTGGAGEREIGGLAPEAGADRRSVPDDFMHGRLKCLVIAYLAPIADGPAGVDDINQRNGVYIEALVQLLLRVGNQGEFRLECLLKIEDFLGFIADGDADHFHILVVALNGVDQRHFVPAGMAVHVEMKEQNRFGGKLGKRDHRAADIPG